MIIELFYQEVIKMEEFIRVLREKNAALNQEAAELRRQNKNDEAVFCTVRANVYDICAAVCRVHSEKGNISAIGEIYSRFQDEWSASLENAKRQNQAKKICIEESKLEALADIRARFSAERNE